MSIFNLDVIDREAGYCDILESLGGEVPGDEEIFEVLKQYDSLPYCIENIYYELLLQGIVSLVTEEYEVECSFFVNDLDTHLYLNGEEVWDLDDFNKRLEL